MATLVLTHQGAELLWFHLRERTTIGRDGRCDIPLADPTVSREQAAIERRGAHYVLLDLSGQGTLVGGRPTREARLADGDELRLGEWVATFRESVLSGAATVREARAPGTDVLPRRLLAPDELQIRVRGQLGERIYAVAQDELTLGSAAGNDLVLEDRFVSAWHARVRRTPEGLWVEDLGSTNGIFLSSPGLGAEQLRIQRAAWAPGVALRLGQTELRLETVSARPGPEGDFGGLVGRSSPMLQLFDFIQLVAPQGMPVLIQGESGSGKEGVARAIHERSQRKGGPFLELNCGVLSPTLVESQLFGHEKGAFTGAIRQHKGFFEEAHGGTLFLDEIGELPLELQPKLLRVLQEGEVMRVGSSQAFKVDVRLVAATHVDLLRRVRAKEFRQDLYYRLNVFPLRVPRLPERLDDLPRLVAHLVQKHAPRGEPVKVASGAMDRLMAHDYPGNVRELETLVVRALLLRRGSPSIEAQHIVFDGPLTEADEADEVAAPADDDRCLALEGRTLKEATLEVKKRAIRRHGGNRREAAKELDVDRNTLGNIEV